MTETKRERRRKARLSDIARTAEQAYKNAEDNREGAEKFQKGETRNVDTSMGYLGRGSEQAVDKDKTLIDYTGLSRDQVLHVKLNRVLRLVENIWNRTTADKQEEKNPYQKSFEPVYEIYVGGKATGIQGSRSDLENRIVAVAPAETVPPPNIEEFISKIPIKCPEGSKDEKVQKEEYPEKLNTHYCGALKCQGNHVTTSQDCY